jgi:hypothetical protein
MWMLTLTIEDSKTSKFNGRTSKGNFWVSDVLDMFLKFGKSEDLNGIYDSEDNTVESRKKALRIIKSLSQVYLIFIAPFE